MDDIFHNIGPSMLAGGATVAVMGVFAAIGVFARRPAGKWNPDLGKYASYFVMLGVVLGFAGLIAWVVATNKR